MAMRSPLLRRALFCNLLDIPKSVLATEVSFGHRRSSWQTRKEQVHSITTFPQSLDIYANENAHNTSIVQHVHCQHVSRC
eukprot:1676013-Pleurochrysis_carterae.AAC.1